MSGISSSKPSALFCAQPVDQHFDFWHRKSREGDLEIGINGHQILDFSAEEFLVNEKGIREAKSPNILGDLLDLLF